MCRSNRHTPGVNPSAETDHGVGRVAILIQEPLMIFNGTLISVVTASLLLLGSATAYGASPIPVGEVAPKFELNNQAGKATSLADLVKNMPVALIFYRSADW
jgi:hypothetical protein